jgi:protein-L-isoaspartate(D-aspartate) O-methyltransferase
MRDKRTTSLLTRRQTLAGASAVLGSLAFAQSTAAAYESSNPTESLLPYNNREDFIRWMEINRKEQPPVLSQRWERYLRLRLNRDITDAKNARAFLITPRDQFVLPRDVLRAYDNGYLDIGFGATISGPGIVARMTSALDVSAGEKVLEIGTGSGYQSAYLANLTDGVWTIELVGELADRALTRRETLLGLGHKEYGSISARQGNGYFGWTEAAPFDKIVVTCAIDHIPPPLFDQLKPGGTMVLPLGMPSSQHVIKIVKAKENSGKFQKIDIFHGKQIRFLPMIQGTTVA